MMATHEHSGVTHDTLYDGRVQIVQPERGFRANTDSLLLAAALNAAPGGHALDAGCGCGGALLTAAHRLPDVRFTGVELEAEMAALARTGAEKNGYGDRVQVETGDLAQWARGFENRFDAVISNPPYFTPGSTSEPGEGRAAAYVETVPLEDWLKAMIFAARPRAPITIIHRAAELARLLSAFDRWTGEITVLPLLPAPGEEANRVIVRGRKGLKRGRVRLLAGLAMRSAPGGELSEMMQAIERGEGITAFSG